ncbi:MAG TPA: sulfite exporter TauE/SafE family protein [Firmicutes bacterium]|nr:sulfite exporter TauE/SafE family protein [Bacillota bacterium]
MKHCRQKKKLHILTAAFPAVAAMMVLCTAVTAAGEPAADLPAMLGGESAYAPAYLDIPLFILAILLGLATGLMTGAIGVGGGFVVTPALMSVGIQGILAVGTGMFYVFSTAIMGSVIHRKLGNVSIPLAAAFVLGSFLGVNAGAGINRAIYQANPLLSDALITFLYVALLGLLGAYALYDYRRLSRAAAGTAHAADPATSTGTANDAGGAHPGKLSLSRMAQRCHLPPMIATGNGGRISAWLVALCGFVVGFLASIMGVGGGFLTFPAYVYGLGIAPLLAVGTDTLQIVFTAGYASIFKYAAYGFVFYSLAVGLLTGSLIGVQLGAMATKLVSERHIKGFYAITILAAFVNRLCALPQKLGDLGYLSLPHAVGKAIGSGGTIVFFAVIALFAIWVLSVLIRSFFDGERRAGSAGAAEYGD